MAGLPPKPETHPVREERRFTDDRDRRSAVPMAAAGIRRHPIPPDRERDRERERPYVPRPKLDSYIAPQFDPRREGDLRREYDDRDRERYRPPDDRRSWTRDRDHPPSPRRRDIAERDRRPFDRDRDRGLPLPRRPLSPRRGYPRRDSRSPGWRRPRSRSHTPPRYRHRSRSRSPRRPPSPPLLRFGERSIHSPSPVKTKHSREPSPRLPPKPTQPLILPLVDDEKKDIRTTSMTASTPTPNLERQTSIPPQLNELAHTPNAPSLNSMPSPGQIVKQEPEEEPEPPSPPTHEEQVYIKPEPQTTLIPEATMTEHSPKVETPTTVHSDKPFVPPVASEPWVAPPKLEPKMEESLNSPSLATPVSTKRSLSPAPSRPFSESANSSATHDSKAWSAPRGPRAHARLPPQPPPLLNPPRKRSRYDHISAALSNFPVPSNPIQKHQLKNPEVIKIEQEIEKIHAAAMMIEKDHVHHVKGLQRALHELDLATIDLRAADTRRKIADAQLERAKTGMLGIEGADLPHS